MIENEFKLEWENWFSNSSIKAGLGQVRVITADNPDGLMRAIEVGLDECWQFLPLGHGTNFIGSDCPRDESKAVIRYRADAKKQVKIKENGVFTIDSCVSLRSMILSAAEQGYGGMAALSGIPGTVGGALAMNAGANRFEISQFVTAKEGIDIREGTPWRWGKCEENASDWSYRTSPVPKTVLVTSAEFQLESVSPESEFMLIEAERQRRKLVTPRGLSCGSVFRNPPEASAGKLLEQAGCKGLSIGVFSVSEQHANWIVNLSGKPGSAEDCKALVNEMRRRVEEKTGIALKTEWRFADEA